MGRGKKVKVNPETGKNYPAISTTKYKSLKRALLKKEPLNYTRINFVYCAGKAGWVEAGDHSAMVYFYEVAQRLGLANDFFNDALSIYDQYEIGYVRVQSFQDAVRFAKQAKIYAKHGVDENEIMYIELLRPVPEEKMKEYEQGIKERRLEQLTVIPAYNLAPEFYQLLVNFGSRMYSYCNKLNRFATETTARDLIEHLNNSMTNYHYITYTKPGATDYIKKRWDTITKDLKLIIVDLKVMCDFRLMPHEDCIEFVSVLDRMVELAERELKNIKKGKEEDAAKKV